MKIPPLKNLMPPLLVIAFTGTVVKYFNQIFTGNTRWAVLVLVFLYILVAQQRVLASLLRTGFMRLVLISVAWILATSLWSVMPLLSQLKGMAFFLVVIAGVGSGYMWVQQHSPEKALEYLAPLVLMVFIAALFGRDMIKNTEEAYGLTMFQGLTGNSNMFGSLVAMAFPYSIWKYSVTNSRLWLLASFVLVALVLMSNSRAAIVIAFLSGIPFLIASNANKKLPLWLLSVFIIPLVLLALPSDIVDSLKSQYIYKQAYQEDVGGSFDKSDVFFTRDEAWDRSYESAMKGGIAGAGYGVSIGDGYFAFSLSAVGYGREKGSSQMGILEETGIIGLMLYLLVIGALFYNGYSGWRRCRDLRIRSLIVLVFGVLAGFIFQSVFEGWYGAPGAPESMYFWMMTGVGIGLVRSVKKGACDAKGLAAPRAQNK